MSETNSDAKSSTKEAKTGRRLWTGLEKGLIASTAAAVAAAAVGFALFAGSYVPADAAAKVDGFFIGEDRVEGYIDEYRARYDAEEDAAFASALLAQGMNVYTFRQSAINQIALNQLIDDRAEELGVAPSDGDVDAEIAKEKEDAGGDGKWQEYLDGMGATEDSLRSQVRTNMAEQRVYEAAVERQDPTDDDVKDYMKSQRDEGSEHHTWRITFTGDDAKKRAESCLAEAKELGGKLNAETFSKLAKKRSDSPTVKDDAGDAGWTYSQEGTKYSAAVSGLAEGELSGVEETDTEGNYGIAYCDEVYECPPANGLDDFDLNKLPDSLLERYRDLAEDALWETDCKAYLANLLGDAKITYYPIPDGAPYNVDLKLAAMASGEALSNAG